MNGLAGKLVVVTGAAGGIGRAQVDSLVEEGATVVALDQIAPGDLPPTVEARALDVTDAGGWAALAQELRERNHHVHGLVNHAGIIDRARLADVSSDDVHRAVDVNLIGPMLGIQHLSPLMSNGSSIVTIGSVASITAYFPVAYATSKWALRGLTRIAATELGPRGIRVNAVHPGFTETPMTAASSDAFRAANVALTPLGRTGRPDDIASVVTFLLGDGARYVTGAEIPVDGGMAAHGGVKALSDVGSPAP